MSSPATTSGFRRRRVRPAPGSRSPGAGWRTGRAPCAGRGSPARAAARAASLSYFGSPTAPNSTASAALASASVASRQRMAVRVVGGAADQRLLDLERQARARRARARACGDDLGADAVAGQDCDFHVASGSVCIGQTHVGEPGLRREALGLEGLDLVGVPQRQADVVEAVEQAVLAERRRRRTRDSRAVGRDDHLLLAGRSSSSKPGERGDVVEQPVDLALRQHDRQQAVLEAVVEEDVGEARRDHRAEAVLLAAPTARARATSRSRSSCARAGSTRPGSAAGSARSRG